MRERLRARLGSIVVGKPVLLLFERLYNELFVTNYPRGQVVAGDGPILGLPAYLEKDAVAAFIGRISFKNGFIFFPEIKLVYASIDLDKRSKRNVRNKEEWHGI